MGVDLLRVISITLVILSHYGLMQGFILSGVHGVAIFFMISGYCMYYSTHGRTGINFLRARFWRLIPTLFICATLTSLIEISNVIPDRSQSFRSYLLNLVCLPNGNLICDVISFLGRGKGIGYAWVDGAYWSLLVEIRFYILLWLLFYVLKTKRVEFILAAIGIFAAFNESVNLFSKSQDFLLYLSFFAFGMAYRSICAAEKYAFLGLLFSLCVFFINGIMGSIGISMSLNKNNLLSFFICHVIFVLVMLSFKTRSNYIVSYLGLISYPLYLIHQDVGLILIKTIEPYFGQFVAAVVTILLAVLVSMGIQFILDNYSNFHIRKNEI